MVQADMPAYHGTIAPFFMQVGLLPTGQLRFFSSRGVTAAQSPAYVRLVSLYLVIVLTRIRLQDRRTRGDAGGVELVLALRIGAHVDYMVACCSDH
jgi:hypothetical protein